MAIDSAAKRKSAAWMVAPFPVTQTPTASPAEAWRQTAGWGYEGIATATAVAPTPIQIASMTLRTWGPEAMTLKTADPAPQTLRYADPDPMDLEMGS